jgi:hypothetical protein
MIIGLEDEVFSMVNMNLFGHVPIHDFRLAGRFNKPHIQNTLKEINDLY